MQNSLTGPRNENNAREISNIHLTSVTKICPQGSSYHHTSYLHAPIIHFFQGRRGGGGGVRKTSD